MLVNKIKIMVVSLVFGSFAFAGDMETKSLDLSMDLVSVVKDSKQPKLMIGHGELRERLGRQASEYAEAYAWPGIAGQVIVEFDVTPIGRVTNSTIIQSPSNELGKIVLSRIEYMEFEPGTQNGKKVTVRHRMPITFDKN